MDFYVMTLFPEMIESGLNTSILGRAAEKGLIRVHAVNIRDFTLNKHRRVDDYPYGGGAGMLMAAEPVVRTYDYIRGEIEKNRQAALQTSETGETERLVSHTSEAEAGRQTVFQASELTNFSRLRVIYVTPWGRRFTQETARELAKEETLVFLCGHYEGIDERALDVVATDFYSIGDYVLTGGELPAMVMIDAIARLVPGVLNNSDSAEHESFSDGLLEHPQYTRPEEYNGVRVPEVLLSGHHANIEKWRKEQSVERTKKYRPDLL